MQMSTVTGIGQEDGKSAAGLKCFQQAPFIPVLREAAVCASDLWLGAPAVLPTTEPAIPGGCRDLGRDHCSPQHIPEREVRHPPFGCRAHPVDSPKAAAEGRCHE